MEYKCVDRGGLRCPCVLMEAGQCYICTMSRTGKCNCGENWRGVCPYNEFIQNGLKHAGLLKPFKAKVEKVVEYSDLLKVIRLKVPTGFAQRCQAAGSYVMVEALGYKLPLSVLRAKPWDKGGQQGYSVDMADVPDKFSSGYVEFAVQPAGPKSMEILKNDEGSWQIYGPFAAGLANMERLTDNIQKKQRILVIAKGTAIAPYINIKENMDAELIIDDDKLSEDFLKTYLNEKNYEEISLYNEFDKLLPKIDSYSQIMFLASPYYTEKILRLRPERKDDIIIPNHANICCGVGICGACSYTDADGVTVRKCKCTER